MALCWLAVEFEEDAEVAGFATLGVVRPRGDVLIGFSPIL
jgi:hypothetical protein